MAKSSGISTRESESLDRYLHEIGKEKLITPDDEVRLANEIQKGSTFLNIFRCAPSLCSGE